MTTLGIRPATRLGPALLSLALLAAGCVGTGEAPSSPSGSTPGSPSAASPSPSPSASALPAVLAAKTWVTLDPVGSLGAAVAGTLDGRYHLTLPPTEVGLTAADFRVVSAIWTKAADGSVEGTTLVVRDLRQAGAEIARFTTAGQVAAGQAVLSGDTLFFAGNGASDRIAGLYAGSLGDGSVRTLVEPGPVPDNLGASSGSVVLALQMAPGVSRGPVVLSPSGRTLGSAVCGNGRCTVELVDPSAASVVRELDGLSDGLWFVTDTTLITVALGRFGALDRAGNRLWSMDPAMAGPGYLTSDGDSLVVLYQDLQTNAERLSVFSLATGAERIVKEWSRSEPAPWLWAAVSTDDVAVLLSGATDPASAFDAGGGSFRADLLDLGTGTADPGALLVSAR